jgi:hypothetical protein
MYTTGNKAIHSQDASCKNAPGKTVFFQPKLTVNQPNDIYEQEADSMANRVMRMSDPIHNENAFFKPAPVTIQRKCQHCEEEKLHRKESSGAEAQGSHELDNYVGSLSTSGQVLPQSSRSFFEPRFGHDFSNVRVHTDSVAAKSAQSINALAYTTGSNIVFNSGQYSPESDSGKRLMAHELTHVVQQGATKPNIQKQEFDPLDGGMPPGGLPSEQQAVNPPIAAEAEPLSSSSGSSGSSGGGSGGAGTVPAGDCQVDVRATKITALGGLPVYHLFVILRNKTTGDESYYRGGPSAGGPGYGNISTMHGRYLPGTVDWEPSAPSVTAQASIDCTTTDTCFVSELTRIDGTATPYAPLGPNSNTVARTILHNCSVPEVKPVWVAPGWGNAYL